MKDLSEKHMELSQTIASLSGSIRMEKGCNRCDFCQSMENKKELKRRNTMKSSTKDQTEGTFHKMKGKIKEVAGKLSDNPELEAEGTGEKIAGKVQEKIGQVKKVWGK
jgi:uncharacterized protein YjbJ (UPF0337 family)